MKYCEVIIGPPGSGKSTYIKRKKEFLKHRNLFIMNLDPGNLHAEEYDYSITDSHTVLEYQKVYDKGPNASTKEILDIFTSDIENFYYAYLQDTEDYILMDFPGQSEYFINGDSLRKMLTFLSRKDINVVVVNLVDLVFFNISLLSSYLFTYTSIAMLEVPYVCVISKCDNYKKFEMSYNLEEIANFDRLEEKKENFGLYKLKENLIEFLSYNQIKYEILDYENKNTINLLQYVIDKSSGYIYDCDFYEKEEYYKDIEISNIYDNYVMSHQQT